ncbi:MAG: hypothetical protein ACI4EA_07195 [Candidatus Ornithomonoglobus sp.]
MGVPYEKRLSPDTKKNQAMVFNELVKRIMQGYVFTDLIPDTRALFVTNVITPDNKCYKNVVVSCGVTDKSMVFTIFLPSKEIKTIRIGCDDVCRLLCLIRSEQTARITDFIDNLSKKEGEAGV